MLPVKWRGFKPMEMLPRHKEARLFSFARLRWEGEGSLFSELCFLLIIYKISHQFGLLGYGSRRRSRSCFRFEGRSNAADQGANNGGK